MQRLPYRWLHAVRPGRSQPRPRRARGTSAGEVAARESSKRPSGCARGPSRGSSTRAADRERPPGLHHVWARASKTSIRASRRCEATTSPQGRLTAMGFRRDRGREGARLTNKHEIEAFGVAEFTQRCATPCRATSRTGPRSPSDQESGSTPRRVLDAVQRVHRIGLVDHPPDVGQGPHLRGHRVTPYCRAAALRSRATKSRRATKTSSTLCIRALPDHLRRPDRSRPPVWTTTPWTLVSNVAVAAGPDIVYVQLRGGAGRDLVPRKRPSTATSARAWAKSSPASPVATWRGGTTSDRSPTCRSTKRRRGSSSRTT